MKIAMVSEHASPLAAIGGVDAGGQNLHVAELATALARRGDDVTVYTRRDCADLPEVVHAPTGFTVVHVPAGPPIAVPKDELLQHMPGFGDWLRQRWVGSTPDVVHAHFWMSGVAAARATAGRDIPVVLTYHALGSVKRRHQGEADTSPRQRIAIERQLGRRVDRVIAQCPDEVAELTELGVPASSIDTIASGVDTNRFRPAGRAARRRGDLGRVLTVGRLVARKGYEDLIRAIAGLPDAELVIAGGAPGGIAADPEARRLRTIADGLGVSSRVHMLGAVERALMPDWYRSADVVAATPWYEPFGLTPLEAMACGVPTVAYAVGGLRESIVDGVTGLHVRPGDIEHLAATLRRVLADQSLQASLGRAGVARASTQYRWDGVANRIAAVYQACLRRRSQPAWPDERVAP